MALFNINIKKRDHVTRIEWGNRYIINAADLATAEGTYAFIVAAEKLFHFDRVDFLQALVSTVVEGDPFFVSNVLTGTGAQITTGKTMPLFCTMDVTFGASGGGRPGRKFYHTLFDDVFYDADLTYDAALLSDADEALTELMADLVDNDTPLVSPGDILYTSVAVLPDVLSHQFTKASKRAAAGP